MTGFGFSIGDIFAVAEFVYDTKKAVSESAGSQAGYEGLIAALDSTEKALTHLALLDVDDKHRPALKSILLGYEKAFVQFDRRTRPYERSLGSGKRLKWWQEFPKKIKWHKCAQSDIVRFQGELQMHANAMQSLVLKIMQ